MAASVKKKSKRLEKVSKRRSDPNKKTYTAATADRHELYELSVQNVEAEIDFVEAEFKRLKGRDAVRLREDFAGTGNTACEWARRGTDHEAYALDIHAETIQWGRDNNLTRLDAEQRARVHLLERNVLDPGDAVGMDCVLAMNFSYWLFDRRELMLDYFRKVRESLVDDGVFFLDFYGGSEAMTEQIEKRKIDGDKLRDSFTYEWDQNKYNPITGKVVCYIHFSFRDKTRIERAFEYTWRLWTLPELRELLVEAGFSAVTVYWEGDELDDDGEETGEGDGVFTPTMEGEADPAFICYISAQK